MIEDDDNLPFSEMVLKFADKVSPCPSEILCILESAVVSVYMNTHLFPAVM